jgi:hypothetical protein
LVEPNLTGRAGHGILRQHHVERRRVGGGVQRRALAEEQRAANGGRFGQGRRVAGIALNSDSLDAEEVGNRRSRARDRQRCDERRQHHQRDHRDHPPCDAARRPDRTNPGADAGGDIRCRGEEVVPARQ